MAKESRSSWNPWKLIPRRSCSVSWRARWGSMTPMMGRMRSRSRTGSTGVDSSRMASCCWRRDLASANGAPRRPKLYLGDARCT
jgi:hypothetical protein